MSIYIHIGYPKAASTWLKTKLLPAVSNIKLHNSKELKNSFLEPGAFDFYVSAVRENFTIEKSKDCWISAELLTNKVKTGGINGFVTKEVASRLKDVFPQAKIVFFIRNQFDILASSYLQYIKGGGNYGINKFLFPERYAGIAANKQTILSLDFFCYEKTIAYYAELFGRENIHVFLYEELAKDPDKFISGFSSKFGLTLDNNEIDFSPANTSYRKGLILSRRLGNIFTRCGPLNKYYLIHLPKWNYVNRKIHDFANQFWLFGKRPSSAETIGRKNWTIIAEYYKESNQNLMQEYGIKGMTNFNYPL